MIRHFIFCHFIFCQIFNDLTKNWGTKNKKIAIRKRGLAPCGLVLCIALVIGCRAAKQPEPTPPPETSFSEQLAKVKAGQADEIRLEHIAVGESELEQLAGLTTLRALVLDAGIVRDSQIKHLALLAGLQHLRLRESPLTDEGLQQLASGQLQSLLILNLPQAKPTAVGLRALASLPKLRQLRIAGRQIDDAAIEELAHWPALSSLHLIQPGITAQSLETIATMSELSSLYIDACALPDEAWAKLFMAKPNLHVHVDQAHHDLDPRAH